MPRGSSAPACLESSDILHLLSKVYNCQNTEDPTDYHYEVINGKGSKVYIDFSSARDLFGEDYQIVAAWHSHPSGLNVVPGPSIMDFFQAVGNSDVLMVIDMPGGTSLDSVFYGAQSGTSTVSPYKLHELWNLQLREHNGSFFARMLDNTYMRPARPSQTYEEILAMPAHIPDRVFGGF